MKKTTIAIATLCLLFGCQKETNNPPIPERHLINSGVESSVKTGDTTTVTYLNTNISVKATDAGGILIYHGNKSIEAFAKLTTDQEGIRTFSLSDKEGNLYYSIKVTAEGRLEDLTEEKQIPLELLDQHSGIQSVHGTDSRCMTEAFKSCSRIAACYISCETTLIGLAACSLGWKAGCLWIN